MLSFTINAMPPLPWRALTQITLWNVCDLCCLPARHDPAMHGAGARQEPRMYRGHFLSPNLKTKWQIC